MRADGASEQAILAFSHSFKLASEGYDGTVAEDSIEPLSNVTHVDDLPIGEKSPGLEATAVIRLNGGLGTSMGITRAKGALHVRDSLTFLDFSIRQILALRSTSKVTLPVVFMNSYRTAEDTNAILRAYPTLPAGGFPLNIMQGRVPKLDAQTFAPVEEVNRDLEWCPPGHGELLALLESTGLRESLLDGGYRFLFVSNSDNLGALPDQRVPDWMQQQNIPMVMEVCRRSLSDMKGGHIARDRGSGRLILRDSNMVVPGEERLYQDISLHRFFNTNCLWFDLIALSDKIKKSGSIPLPVIVNPKSVDPSSPQSRQVLQLETGMGTAISAFDGARVIEVPRSKFIPVKNTNHLLVARSDFFEYSKRSYRLKPARSQWPLVDLDREYYGTLSDFDRRFAHGVPSMRNCESLSIRGDVSFGQLVECRGDVDINVERKTHIANYTVLSPD